MTNPTPPLVNDPNDMIALMDSWPQLIDYLNTNLDFTKLTPLKQNQFQTITIIGMGGSGISGDLIKEFFQPYIQIPITVIKDYTIPPYINEHSLVIILSYSGNTEETINGLLQAQEKQASIIAISSNGEIEKICTRQNHVFFKVPGQYQPRAALPLLLFPALLSLETIFTNTMKIDLNKIRQIFETIKQQTTSLTPYIEQLQQKIVFIYAAHPFHSIGYRFQCQLNENAKTHAAFFQVPEQNHNAIVPFQNNTPFPLTYVFLRHQYEHPRNQLRLDYMINFLKNKNLPVITFNAPNYEHPFLDALALLYLLDYLSVFLANAQNQDPTDITAINGLKQYLKAQKQ